MKILKLKKSRNQKLYEMRRQILKPMIRQKILMGILTLLAVLANISAKAQCNAVVLDNVDELDDVGVLVNSACSLLVCPGTLVKTRGYFTAGDGGAAEYRIVSPAPSSPAPRSGIDHLICSNGGVETWAMFQYDGTIRVEQAGLVGDNTTNDFPPLANLTFYMETHTDPNQTSNTSQGGVIKFRGDRTYKMDLNNDSTYGASARIPNNFTIDGEGATLNVGSYTGRKSLFVRSAATTTKRLCVKNITITGSADYLDVGYGAVKTSNVTGFNLNGPVENILVDNAVFNNLHYPIQTHKEGNEYRSVNSTYNNSLVQINASIVKNVYVSNCTFFQDTSLIEDPDSAGHLHHVYTHDCVNMKFVNCVFEGHFGDCLTLQQNTIPGSLYISNIEMINANKINNSTARAVMNNIVCTANTSFLDIGLNSHTEISNLDYEYTGSQHSSFIECADWKDTTKHEYNDSNRLTLVNSQIRGPMAWDMSGFQYLSVSNVNFFDIISGSKTPFFTASHSHIYLGQASFDNINVRIENFQVHPASNSKFFNLKSTEPGKLQLTNSTFYIDPTASDGTSAAIGSDQSLVFVLYETGQESIVMDNIGVDNFKHVCAEGNDATHLRVGNFYDLSTNEVHGDLNFELTWGGTKKTYLQNVIRCTTSPNQEVELQDASYDGYSVTIIPAHLSGMPPVVSPVKVKLPLGTTSSIFDGVSPQTITVPTTYTKYGTVWYAK